MHAYNNIFWFRNTTGFIIWHQKVFMRCVEGVMAKKRTYRPPPPKPGPKMVNSRFDRYFHALPIDQQAPNILVDMAPLNQNILHASVLVMCGRSYGKKGNLPIVAPKAGTKNCELKI
jgi:hypothetical protein